MHLFLKNFNDFRGLRGDATIYSISNKKKLPATFFSVFCRASLIHRSLIDYLKYKKKN
jgi:hypothetical protein